MMACFICLVLITALTFDIEEPLLTEPLLNLPSGQPGGLDQPVDLKPHRVSKLKVVTQTLPPSLQRAENHHPAPVPHLFFLRKGTLSVAGPQDRELLGRLVRVKGETQYFRRHELRRSGGSGRGRRGLNDGGPLALRGDRGGGHRTFQRLGHLRQRGWKKTPRDEKKNTTL